MATDIKQFYDNFNPAVPAVTPYGTVKDDSSEGAGDGSEARADMITNLAYAIYQVLDKVGEVPSNDVENLDTANLNSQQFINSLEKAFLDRSEFTVKGAIPMGTGSTTKGSEVGYLTGGTDGQIIVKDSGEATGFRFDDIADIGIWTCALVPTSGTITINPASDTGSFIKLKCGLVVLRGKFTISAISAPFGDLNLTGAPFPNRVLDENAGVCSGSVLIDGLASPISTYASLTMNEGSSSIQIREAGGTGFGNDIANHFDAGSTIHINITYLT